MSDTHFSRRMPADPTRFVLVGTSHAGNVGATAEYRWTVSTKPADPTPPATPPTLDARISSRATVENGNTVGVGCTIEGDTVSSCTVKAYADVKDNSDSGQFLAIQQACAYALDHPEQTQQIAAKYSRRMDGLVSVLNKHGFAARKPKGSFFLYVKAPKSATTNGQRVAFERGENFSQWMITEKLISTVPWDDAGAYVRFSVTFVASNPADEQRVLGEIDKRLGSSTFEF